jgi:hypothetical protein
MKPASGLFIASLLAGVGGCGGGTGTITVKVDSLPVPAGSEVQNCYYLKAPNDQPVDIGHVLVEFGPGTHHAHIYYGTEDHPDGGEECFNAVDFDKWHLLVATQREKLDWQLPDGVAMQIAAHQQLLVQVHYVNLGKLTADNNVGGGTFTFDERRASEVKEHLGSVFGQQRDIHIAPDSSFSVDGLCKLPREVDLGAFAGHYHFRGKDFIGYKTGLDGVGADEFYRTDNFAQPDFSTYDQSNPMHVGVDEQLMWHCDYQNDTNMEIDFGPREADQEHCNMFVFYYPAASPQEFTPCVSWDRCSQQCTDQQTCNQAGQCVAK